MDAPFRCRVAGVRLACEPQRYASPAQDTMIGHGRRTRIGDLRPQLRQSSDPVSYSYSAICRPASAQGITKNSPYAAHKLGGLAERPCTVTRAIFIPVPGTRSTPLSSYLPEVRQRASGAAP
jgi:hypothetical protein